MGDRANVVVKDGRSQVWFYGHWMGEAYVIRTKEALARRVRWDDASYLARIIFDALTEGCHGEETGFGISTRILDNEHPILVVDVPAGQVYFVTEDELTDFRVPDDHVPQEPKTFEQFVTDA